MDSSLPPDPLPDRTAAVQGQIAIALANPSEDAVHDLRVSIRRLLEALRAFKPQIDKHERRHLRKQLRRIMRAAGQARNLDIAVELCARCPEAGPTSLTRLRGLRLAAAHHLIETLLAIEPASIVPPARKEPYPGGAVMAAALLPRLVDDYWRAGDHAASRADDWKGLHQFRLATKHLRYTIELFAGCYHPRGLRPRLEVLRRMQGHLGRINDCESARGLDAIRADAGFRSWLAARQDQERDKFLAAWNEEARQGVTSRRWKQYFSRPAFGNGPRLVK